MEETTTVKKLQSEIRHLEQDVADLKASNGDLGHLLHMIADGLMMISKDGRITYVNQALEQMIGCRREEMIGGPFGDQRWNFKTVDAQSTADNSVISSVFSNRPRVVG